MPNTATTTLPNATRRTLPQSTAMDEAAQQHRADAYRVLASVLRAPPTREILQAIGGFADIGQRKDELGIAMALLGLAARNSEPRALDDEFHELFIGIGRGELVPFGSWYQTGFLMEKPLGLLRDDLRKLGIERCDSVKEPEDHVAALCETLVILISDATPLSLQADFFQTHMASWFERFFSDLQNAQCAAFYKSVGRFGAAFSAFEQRYLSMPA